MKFASPTALMTLLVEEVETGELSFTSKFIRDVIEVSAPVAKVCRNRTLLEVVPILFGCGLGEDKAEVLIELSRKDAFEKMRLALSEHRLCLEVRRMSPAVARPWLGKSRSMADKAVSFSIFGSVDEHCSLFIKHDIRHDIVVVQFR
jgi:hypothetical protein